MGRAAKALRHAARAMLAIGLAAGLGGCTGEPPPPGYVGKWMQDGYPSRSTAFLHLDDDRTFVLRRMMSTSSKIGPTHKGQWRIGDNGQIQLYKYLSKGGVSFEPLAVYTYDETRGLLMPVHAETLEVKGRHYVRRFTMPDIVVREDNASPSLLAQQAVEAAQKAGITPRTD